MLKALLKKQLAEVFRNYFFDPKKNRMRSKASIALWFVFFFAVMVGMLGGMFTFFSLSMCEGMILAETDWLYFVIMAGIAIVLGAFGSVFNTYSGLYLAKDNDLLLSMPIPVETIITARLLGVYLMGAMYSATVLIPTIIVYWITAGATFANVFCGIVLFLIVTLIVLLLSCLLGFVVAKISVKLKNKSFITVLLALAFIGAYYFVYFKANDMIRDIIANASVYGMKIKGAAYVLYMFGKIGEGDFAAAAIFFFAALILFALMLFILSRSFLNIAAAGGKAQKSRYTEKRVKKRSVFGALLGKEFARFTSSPNYMLNCGLGVLFIPALGVFLLIKGREIIPVIDMLFAQKPDAFAILVCTALCMVASMNDVAAPSVSLEGKSIWIPRSLPVLPKTVILAKACVQIILNAIPMFFAVICAVITIPSSVFAKILICALPLTFVLFSALFAVFFGVRSPVLSWTNELAPINQRAPGAIALFGGWGVCAAFCGLYVLVGYKIGAEFYMLIWTALFAAVSLILLKWIDAKGADCFESL